MTEKQIQFMDVLMGINKLAQTMDSDEMMSDERVDVYTESISMLACNMGYEELRDLHILSRIMNATISAMVTDNVDKVVAGVV